MTRSEAYAKLTIAIFLVLGVVALSSIFTLAQARSLDEITKSKEIRICLVASHDTSTDNWAKPPGCRDDCTEFGGYRYDTAMAFVETLDDDIKPKFVRIEWDEQFHNEEGRTVKEASYTPALLASNTCDVYPNVLYEVDWRQTKFDFVSLALYRDVIIVHETQKVQIKTPADLGGKLTAFGKGLAGQSWFEEQNKSTYANNPVKIKVVEDFEDVIGLLEAGEIDFIYMYPEVVLGPRGQKIKDVVTAFSLGPRYKGSWAFRKEDKDLQAAVQAFFDTQIPDPNSALTQAWKKNFKLTLPEWNELMMKQ